MKIEKCKLKIAKYPVTPSICFLAKFAREKVICDRSQARRQAGDMCYEIEDEYAHITYHIPPYEPSKRIYPLSEEMTLDVGLMFTYHI
jgi:hypothetical protein